MMQNPKINFEKFITENATRFQKTTGDFLIYWQTHFINQKRPNMPMAHVISTEFLKKQCAQQNHD